MPDVLPVGLQDLLRSSKPAMRSRAKGIEIGVHYYKLAGCNIVLDACSGSVHSVDDVAYDAIGLYGRVDKGEVIARLMEAYPDIAQGDFALLISEIDALKKQGKLFSEDGFADIADKRQELPLKALCLNVSHMCNMTCLYCFAAHGKYGGKDELMPPDTGKRAIDFLIENSGNRECLDVDFFGGEPLMNWDAVKEIVAYARGLERGSGKRFRFTLTTNGLLIDDDVISFTCKEMHNVVLSLDGRPHINDGSRRLPDGSGSYAAVLPKIKKIVQARGGKGYYIRGTYTRRNLDFVSDVLHLADLGFTKLSMEPAVAKKGSPIALKQDDVAKLCEQYEELAREMISRRKQGRGFTFYHYMLDLTKGPCVYKRIAGCGVGTEYLAVTPGGRLYPCHQFIGNEEFLMGDVRNGVQNHDKREEFAGCNIYSREKCRLCWARFYCSGGCAANAYNATGSINGVNEIECELFKKRIECAIALKVSNLATRNANKKTR